MATGDGFRESDGKGVQVTLTATIKGSNQLVYADGWFGMAVESGDSDSVVALNVDDVEWQIELPAAFAGVKGDPIYVDTAQVTAHVPDDGAYSKTAGAGKQFIGRLTSDQDVNNVATFRARFVSE